MNKSNLHPKLIICCVLLVALLVCAAVFSLQVKDLAHQAALEAAATPTAVPPFGNAMAVTPDPNATPVPQVLRVGSQGEEVKSLQARLQTLGFYHDAIDGQYGTGTRDAVYAFQSANGIEADGLAGSETCNLLFSAYAKGAEYSMTPSPASNEPVLSPSPLPETAALYESDGLPLLVNSTHPLPEGYQPLELVNMTDYCDKAIVTIKGKGIEGERIAVDALMEMLRAACDEGISPWQISAGWRSVKYQQQLFNDKVYAYRKQGYSSSKAKAAAKKTVAEPGCSEHHTGLAFDITVPGVSFKGTRQALWLAEHCYEYGFILRYADDKTSVTGIDNEPWHFRYVGVEHARIMQEENLCLEEYILRSNANVA